VTRDKELKLEDGETIGDERFVSGSRECVRVNL
jgi:hypothetical protein